MPNYSFESWSWRAISMAVLFGPVLWNSAANAAELYALVDHSNNIVLQQEFADHPPVPIEGMRWARVIFDLKIPNEHQFKSSRTYYFGPDSVVISNTIEEKSK